MTGCRPGGDARFNEAVCGALSCQTAAAIDEALGLPSKNGTAKKFLDTIS